MNPTLSSSVALLSFLKDKDGQCYSRARGREAKLLNTSTDVEGLNPAAFVYQVHAQEFYDKSDGNLLLATPTSSGKSNVGFYWLKKAGRGLWVVNSSALALQMYDRLSKEFGRDCVGIGMDGYSLDKSELENGRFKYAVITHFKAQELMGQFKSDEFRLVAPVIVWDEADQLDFKTDLILTELKSEFSGIRILAFSGTIATEDRPKLARYFHAEFIESEIRPVELEYHSFLFDRSNDESTEISMLVRSKNRPERTVTVDKGKSNLPAVLMHRWVRKEEPDASVILFSQRQPLAQEVLDALLKEAAQTEEPDMELSKEAEKLPSGGSFADKLLKRAIPYGYGIIHGGVSHQGKQLAIRLYEQRKLKSLMVCLVGIRGLNLPARYFIMCSAHDPKFNVKSPLIDVSMAHQGGGRAGRAGLEKTGHVLVPCRTLPERTTVEEVIFKNSASFIRPRPKHYRDLPVTVARLIRRGQRTEGKLINFMSQTYWGMFVVDQAEVRKATIDAIEELKAFGNTNREMGETERIQLLDPSKDYLWLTSDGMALARLAVTPDEFSALIALTDSYAKIEELGSTAQGEESADGYEIWVDILGEVYSQMENLSSEHSQEAIADVKKYGMAVFNVHDVSYYARGLAIYVRRMLDKAGAYLNHYNLPEGWKQWWRKNIYMRATYGELQLAYNLTAARGIDNAMVRRLMRSGLLTDKVTIGKIEPAQLVQFATCLYGVDKHRPGETSIQEVASALGCSQADWDHAVTQAISGKAVR